MGELSISFVTEGGALEFRKVGETVDLVLVQRCSTSSA